MTSTNNKGRLAVIGNPISHSSSPRMHNYAIASLGLHYTYDACLVEPNKLQETIESFKNKGLLGFNVTIPFKEDIIPFLDHIDETAQCIGAVNTVVNENGRFVGYNTDGDGFIYSLEAESDFLAQGKKVVVLGAGGSAKAIVYALLKKGVAVLTVLNRSVERAELLISAFSGLNSNARLRALSLKDPGLHSILSEAHLVVNTTSVGMDPEPGQCVLSDFSWCTDSHTVYDIIYKPEETVLLRRAKDLGAKVVGGAGMLAGQGMYAFAYFTKIEASFDLFRSQVYK